MWNWTAFYTLSELVSECGGSINHDGQASRKFSLRAFVFLFFISMGASIGALSNPVSNELIRLLVYYKKDETQPTFAACVEAAYIYNSMEENALCVSKQILTS